MRDAQLPRCLPEAFSEPIIADELRAAVSCVATAKRAIAQWIWHEHTTARDRIAPARPKGQDILLGHRGDKPLLRWRPRQPFPSVRNKALRGNIWRVFRCARPRNIGY